MSSRYDIAWASPNPLMKDRRLAFRLIPAGMESLMNWGAVVTSANVKNWPLVPLGGEPSGGGAQFAIARRPFWDFSPGSDAPSGIRCVWATRTVVFSR